MEASQEEFIRWVEREKAAGRDPIAQLRRRENIDEFKKKYSAIRTTGMACPACTDVGKMKEGHLWLTTTKNRMVCRNCETEFYLECLTVSNDELIIRLREQRKADAKNGKERPEDGLKNGNL